MPGAGSIYRLATGEFVGTIHDGDAAGLAAAKAACVGGGLIQMGPGTEGLVLGAGWGGIPPAAGICLVTMEATGNIYISRFHMTDGPDPTKRVHWDCSAISTGVERTIQVLDYSGILPIPINEGASGTFLRSNGGGVQPSWAAVTLTNALLDGANHTDTVAQAVTRGSLIVGNSSFPPKWDELVIGAANTVLMSNGTDPSWSANPALAHDALAHLKPVSVANCSWTTGTDQITAAGLPGTVKVGDYVYLGSNSDVNNQGRFVTALGAGSVTTNATNGGPTITNQTFFFQPGDHFDETLALETGTGAGLFMTLGRGTYNTSVAGGTFQEIRGPVRWMGHGNGSILTDFRVRASGSTATLSGFCLDGAPSGAAGKAYFYVAPGLGTNSAFILPDIDPVANVDTFAVLGLAQTLSSKTLSGANTRILMDGTTNNAVFQSGGGADRLVHDFTGVSALRVATHPDHNYRTVGSITSAMVNRTGETASIGSTVLLTTPAAGLYRVSGYIVVTTAGAAGTIDTTLAWNDGTAARTRVVHTAVNPAATNFEEGEVVIRVDGATNVSYSTTLVGGAGVTYSLYVRAEALG